MRDREKECDRDRQTDRQTDRQKERETERETERERERDRERERERQRECGARILVFEQNQHTSCMLALRSMDFGFVQPVGKTKIHAPFANMQLVCWQKLPAHTAAARPPTRPTVRWLNRSVCPSDCLPTCPLASPHSSPFIHHIAGPSITKATFLPVDLPACPPARLPLQMTARRPSPG